MKKEILTIVALILAVTVVLVYGGVSLAETVENQKALAQTGLIVEFPVPNGDPFNIVLQEPGITWFTMPNANAVGKLEVVSDSVFTVTTFLLSTPDSEPYDLTYDGKSIWFTQKGSHRIGEIEVATGVMTETAVILPAGAQPTGIDAAPDGTLWFALPGINQIGHYPGSGGGIDVFTYDVTGGNFKDVQVATNDIIWFSAPGLNRLVKYTASQDSFSNAPLEEFGIGSFPPGGFTLEAQLPWVSAPTKGWIGRYSPGTLTFWRWHPVIFPNSGPTDLAFRLNGDIREVWYTATAGNMVGYIFVDDDGKLITQIELGLPTQNSNPTSLAVANDGQVWIAENSGQKIALWKPPYTYSTFLPIIIKAGD